METFVTTVSETPAQMWTIVIIGISTVFLCLIALVAMVSVFKLFFGTKAAQVVPSAAAAPNHPRGVDAAVVAVIIAAIAASSGVAASSIRIASIEHSGFNTPVWGHIDRV